MTEEITNATCQACGMCCVAPTDEPAYVDVMEEDEARLGKRFVRLHVLNGSIRTRWADITRGPLKHLRVNKCTALRGNVGHAVSCGVYEDRPHVCRIALVPGDESCRMIREAMKDLAS